MSGIFRASLTRRTLGVTTGAALAGLHQIANGGFLGPAVCKKGINVSILDFMTKSQKIDAISGALALDLTLPIQKALDHLQTIGGGVLDWYDARITSTLVIRGGNITIKPFGGQKLVQSGDVYNSIRISPPSLDAIWAGPGRAIGFLNGIDDAVELLMYDSNDKTRLCDIDISGLHYSYVGPRTNGGRFIDAFSVDRLKVTNNVAVSVANTVSTWYCRDATVSENDLSCGSLGFPLFFFKSYGIVEGNSLRDGFNGFDGKGCYPQTGKTVYQAFDAGYDFHHPIKLHHNKVYNASHWGLTAGYRDNKSEDISKEMPTGITKANWYGEVWGVEIIENTIIFDGIPGVDSSGINLNVNSKYFKVKHNKIYGEGITIFSSMYNKVEENMIVNHRALSTPAISINGVKFGATSRNSQFNIINRNRIINSQPNQPAIWVKGGDYNIIEENKIIGGTMGDNEIKIDSSNSVSLSVGNIVRKNYIYK